MSANSSPVQVQVICGSSSDQNIADKVTSTLYELEVTYELSFLSAHRDPEALDKLIRSSPARIFICVAGLAAALPGVVASKTTKPVIGVPVNGAIGGLDALLSIVQMPKGVPVATVGIDNGQNAAHLAKRILEA